VAEAFHLPDLARWEAEEGTDEAGPPALEGLAYIDLCVTVVDALRGMAVFEGDP
jgi:hypothetical protein